MHLVEEVGADLAGVCPNEDLDLCWLVVTLELDRRKTGARFVLDGAPAALRLISEMEWFTKIVKDFSES